MLYPEGQLYVMVSLNPTVLLFGKTFAPPRRWDTIQRISKKNETTVFYLKNYKYSFGLNRIFLHFDFQKL